MKILIDIKDTIRAHTQRFLDLYASRIDRNFILDYQDIDDECEFNTFPFLDNRGIADRYAYNNFCYENYAYELYAAAPTMNRSLSPNLSYWMTEILTDFNPVPEVTLMCPRESGIAIQSTYDFLSRNGLRFRRVVFPTDCLTESEMYDVVVTASPTLIEHIKGLGGHITAVKIDTPYNKKTNADYSFSDMNEFITSFEDEGAMQTLINSKH